jgi:trehalose/maltose transport system substrate-binding protein
MTAVRRFRRPGACAALLLGSLPLGLACREGGTRAPGPQAQPRAAIGYQSINPSNSSEWALVERFQQETGIQVWQIPGRESVSEYLGHCLGFLRAHKSSPDVYAIDVTWPGILAEHLADLSPYFREDLKQHFPATVQNDTVAGRLVAMPHYTDAGLFFYRTDLLQKYGYARAPDSWDELEAMARRIQDGERKAGNEAFWGYVWQGVASESLTCNALEWQVSHGGGRIIESDGSITVNNRKVARALERATRWVGTISPPSVLSYAEEDARNVFQAGNAAFMRNWPYAHQKGQAEDSPIRGRFDVGRIPSGGAGHAHTLGGWQLAVSRYSTHVPEAVELVRYLTSHRIQREAWLTGARLPTRMDLYDDTELLQATPHFSKFKAFLQDAVARPSDVTGPNYDKVSAAYFTAVHAVLARQAPAPQALAELEAQLVALTGLKPAADR